MLSLPGTDAASVRRDWYCGDVRREKKKERVLENRVKASCGEKNVK